jgi:phosphatidylglycerophosphate synthase
VRAAARQLVAWGIRPNAISALGLGSSIVAAGCLLLGQEQRGELRTLLFVLAGVGIQLRLFCNLIDGLVAVEGRLGAPTGELWNELPDRLSDAICLIAAGYASTSLWGGVTLGWLAALLAVFTAYVRALGTAVGARAHFTGPMAKQRRMDTLTLGALISIFEPGWGWHGETLAITLAVIAAGSGITIIRRVRQITLDLRPH